MRFYKIKEIKKLKQPDKWAVVIAIILKQAIAALFGWWVFTQGNAFASVIILIMFSILAWEK